MKVYKTANSCCFVKLHKQKLCTKDTLSFCHYLFCLLLHFPLLNLAYIGLNFNTELRLFSEVESEHPLVPAMNILLPRKLNYHVLYISSSVWLLRTPNAGGGNLLSLCFCKILMKKWQKIRQKEHSFNLFPIAGWHKNAGLAPYTASKNMFSITLLKSTSKYCYLIHVFTSFS